LQFAIGLETRGQFAILKSPLENRKSKIAISPKLARSSFAIAELRFVLKPEAEIREAAIMATISFASSNTGCTSFLSSK
jgi:hypothetical protein